MGGQRAGAKWLKCTRRGLMPAVRITAKAWYFSHISSDSLGTIGQQGDVPGRRSCHARHPADLKSCEILGESCMQQSVSG